MPASLTSWGIRHEHMKQVLGWAFHGRKKMGFSEVGIYREQGLLDGRWVDVITMELLL